MPRKDCIYFLLCGVAHDRKAWLLGLLLPLLLSVLLQMILAAIEVTLSLPAAMSPRSIATTEMHSRAAGISRLVGALEMATMIFVTGSYSGKPRCSLRHSPLWKHIGVSEMKT